MLTSLRETTRAWEYANPQSKSFVVQDSSINEGGYFVSRILAGASDCIEKITSALQKYASILGEIDKVRTTSDNRSNQLQLGFVILSSDYLEPYKSQLPKSHSCLSKNRGLGSCYADRDSDPLSNGGGRDRLFAN
ncbi:hypothetical protein Osc7112_0522 [Oscillatoria nigro-viridis PCC 7112]|uniref:Uncharacterized protein n=1 Tax=Phormidium nigroviride PCC 7112 TaxID=179408 RepID=K9VD11_9CYAN|nr:hypothetical protein [Oscillatoria nigro-viridis]AFZ05120.1 hypothetical protein Osc7112_0522 [Oscillatoria nigro-viridis PCC 7112]